MALGAVNVGGREQAQPLATLEELVVERIASEVARIAGERIREMFEVSEFDPDEVFGFMTAEEAAEFLGLPYSSFREIAPQLAQARDHAGALRVSQARASSVGTRAVGTLTKLAATLHLLRTG